MQCILIPQVGLTLTNGKRLPAWLLRAKHAGRVTAGVPTGALPLSVVMRSFELTDLHRYRLSAMTRDFS